MSITNLLGRIRRLSDLGIRNDIISLQVFCEQVLQPGACVIKLITTVIYLDSMVKP